MTDDRKRRRGMPGEIAPEQRYAEWLRYLKAAYDEIVHAFWNRKVFRAMRAMFEGNPQLRENEGATTACAWLEEMYWHYCVMLVRRELDTQTEALTLTRMLYDMEKNHEVLRAHAQGTVVPSLEEVRTDRETLQKATREVVDYGHRIVAHRTPLGAKEITWAQLDDALRALRRALIKYNGILRARDLAQATPAPRFDWLGPFRVPWVWPGFEEPEAEEDAPLSEAEKRNRREQRRKLGFAP